LRQTLELALNLRAAERRKKFTTEGTEGNRKAVKGGANEPDREDRGNGRSVMVRGTENLTTDGTENTDLAERKDKGQATSADGLPDRPRPRRREGRSRVSRRGAVVKSVGLAGDGQAGQEIVTNEATVKMIQILVQRWFVTMMGRDV
jgi:hypothetical protein